VSEFKYLRNIIDNKNRNVKCIKERIQAGNKTYYANLQMLKSKNISRRSKLQRCKTLIRPIVTYGAETWTLTLTEDNALRRFETKVLRKINEPVMDKGVWRIRYNFELYRFMGGKDIVRFTKAQRIQWLVM
jgi:predicted DNA binding protein